MRETNHKSREVDILVIDDCRIFYFNPAYLGTSNVTHARTAEEGIFHLKEKAWDEVWLDHDLGLHETIDPVVDFLIENRDNLDIGQVMVHSMNPPGRKRVLGKLTNYNTYEVDLAFHQKKPWLNISYDFTEPVTWQI